MSGYGQIDREVREELALLDRPVFTSHQRLALVEEHDRMMQRWRDRGERAIRAEMDRRIAHRLTK